MRLRLYNPNLSPNLHTPAMSNFVTRYPSHITRQSVPHAISQTYINQILSGTLPKNSPTMNRDHDNLERTSSRTSSILSSVPSLKTDLSSARKWKHSRWRHTLGIILLLVTVVLWTTSNFLASVCLNQSFPSYQVKAFGE